MTYRGPLLLLAGSFEARQLAQTLSDEGVAYTALISEPPRGAGVMPQPPLLRRFEGAGALADWIAAQGFSAVLDASHSFDRTVSEQGAAAARALSLPYLRLERAPWTCEAPNWQRVPSVRAAANGIAAGARVFAATGWDSLPFFSPFAGAVLMLRQTRRHDRPAPYPFVDLIFGDPPFSAQDEETLFRRLAVNHLICRNLGGRASRPKLDAALALGLKVTLIDRPAPPEGTVSVGRIEDALTWALSL